MDISKRIIEIRESKKIKQTEMAEMLSTDRQNYARLEKRGEKLTIEQLTQIANALGVSIGEILDIEEKQDNEKENLKKRIEELEDTIKDKKGIIQRDTHKLEQTKKRIFNKILIFIAAEVYEYGLSEKIVHDKESKKKHSITSYYNFIFNYKDEFQKGNPDIVLSWTIKKENYVKAVNKFFYEKIGYYDDMCELIKDLCDCDLIEDEVIKSAVDKYWDIEYNGLEDGEEYDENLNRIKVSKDN